MFDPVLWALVAAAAVVALGAAALGGWYLNVRQRATHRRQREVAVREELELPEQPLMSEMIGRNTARAMTADSVSWYAAMTLAAAMFSRMLTLSHESRRRARTSSGMVRSSSPPTMPLLSR